MSGFRPLLFVSDYPPSTLAGSPVIVRQYLRGYDMDKLDVLCCERWHKGMGEVVEKSYLPCRHTTVPAADIHRLRPHRIFVPLTILWNYRRVGRIVAEGRRIIRERGIEAIYTSTCSIEFTIAAYRLAREFGLDLYIHEMDDWVDANPWPLNRIKLPERIASLHTAKKVWAVSPAMVREHARKYQIDCQYLHHILDSQVCRAAASGQTPPDDRIEIVYTGSINLMFEETMRRFCDWLNAGVRIDGRPVTMTIYTANEPTAYLGEAVRWGGFVPMEEVPARLGRGHLAAILISWTTDPKILGIIKTSIFTKTIDYLAAGSPTLIVSPPYAAEVEYFRDVACVVEAWDPEAILAALRRMTTDQEYRESLRRKGFELVDAHHGLEALEKKFLSNFRQV